MHHQIQFKSLLAFLILSSSTFAIPVLEDAGTSCSAPKHIPLSDLNPHLSTPSPTSTPQEGKGTCRSTTTCKTNGFNVPGHCPGSTNTQCCISQTCQPSTGAAGLCLNTSDGCVDGAFIAGFCPGNSGIQCCVKKSDTSDKEEVDKGKGSGKDVVAAAVAKEGTTYVYGGGGCKGPSNGGFDCSGLTQYAICRAEGYTIPRTAQQQYHSTLSKQIPRSQAKAGDFIFWGTNGDCTNKVHHVGIFMRSNWMVNAPHTGSVVRESTFEGSSELCDYVVRFWKD